jgi:hypothetical protein
MQCDNDADAVIQLNFAEEHLRRAAIETMHEYASVMYSRLKPKIEGTDLKYRILFLPLPDRKRVKKIKDEINQEMINARMNKGNDWVQSVTNFFNAIASLEDISNEFPPDNEVKKREFELFIGVLTILGFLIAICGAVHLY